LGAGSIVLGITNTTGATAAYIPAIVPAARAIAGTERDGGSFDDVPAIGSLFDDSSGTSAPSAENGPADEPRGHEVVSQPEPALEATTGGNSREPPEVLRVAPAEHHASSQVEPLGEGAAPPLVLGCTACGTTITIAHSSSELLYVCKACKQPLHVIRECSACGNKVTLTQDEYYTTPPSGRHCPVCLELLIG
jgi:hypothetical protein